MVDTVTKILGAVISALLALVLWNVQGLATKMDATAAQATRSTEQIQSLQQQVSTLSEQSRQGQTLQSEVKVLQFALEQFRQQLQSLSNAGIKK